MISLLQNSSRAFVLLLLAAVLGLLTPEAVLAQRAGVNDKIMEEDTSKSYALPYGLVVLGVALGVMIIARPSVRQDEPKKRIDEDEE